MVSRARDLLHREGSRRGIDVDNPASLSRIRGQGGLSRSRPIDHDYRVPKGQLAIRDHLNDRRGSFGILFLVHRSRDRWTLRGSPATMAILRSGRGAVGSARRSGRRGRRFESSRPDSNRRQGDVNCGVPVDELPEHDELAAVAIAANLEHAAARLVPAGSNPLAPTSFTQPSRHASAITHVGRRPSHSRSGVGC